MFKPNSQGMHSLITSHQNAKIKNIISLEKARERKRQNVFIVEGVKELSLAVESEYKMNQRILLS